MQDASSKQQTKQKDKPNHQQTADHLTQPCPSEEKQTNKQKLSTKLTNLTQTTGTTLEGRNKKEERIQP